MAIQQNKITEEELKELNDFQQNINIITYQLGQIELNQHNLNKEKEVIIAQYEQLLLKEKELGDKLKEKYGNSQLDLKTGEIIQSD
jgi:predicted  nucleic acid-binding Zn-ribbon protein